VFEGVAIDPRYDGRKEAAGSNLWNQRQKFPTVATVTAIHA